MHKKRWAAFVLAAALVLTGCSAGSFLHFGKGSGGSTVQKIDRPAVESAELQFAHPMITLQALCRQATTTA